MRFYIRTFWVVTFLGGLPLLSCGQRSDEKNSRTLSTVLADVLESDDPADAPQPGNEIAETISAKCDLPKVKEVFSSKCSNCHANGNALGGYDLGDVSTWTRDVPHLLLGIQVVANGLMPPPGLPQLSSAEKDVFAQCLAADSDPSSESTGGTTSVTVACREENSITDFPSHARLLSKTELRNTLVSILGSEAEDAISDTLRLVPDDGGLDKFSTQTGTVSRNFIDAQEQLADTIGEFLAGNSAARDRIHPCLVDLETVDVTCRDQALAQFAVKFFRRPATEGERAQMLDIWNLGENAADSVQFIGIFVSLHPQFLYLLPEGTKGADGLHSLSQYGIAQRLSYWLWKSPPDTELLNLAAQNKLHGQTIGEQAERLLGDARAKTALKEFVHEWLELGSMSPLPADEEILGDLNPDALKMDMVAEVQEFAASVIQSGGSFQDLLMATESQVTTDLSILYNTPAGETQLPASERAGVLTRAALHVRSETSSPYHMASMIYRRVVNCTELKPPADINLAAVVAEQDDTPKSYRQYFESKTTQPQCIGCHIQLDAYAFGLQYDPIGRFHGTEKILDSEGNFVREQKVNRSVNLFLTGRISDGVSVDGPVELSKKVAESERAQRCFLTQFHRYASGRVESVEQGCSLNRMRLAGGDSIVSQIKQMASSPEFLKFRVVP